MRELDSIIIGAGPAGLTAAIYLKRAGKDIVVIEKETFGGQIINTPDIENYPGLMHKSGFDLAMSFYNQAQELGAEIITDNITAINKDANDFIIDASKEQYKAKSIIIASGCKNRKLPIDDIDAFEGKGISYCATCDGAFYRNKVVAVNGGGNTAVEDALYLSNVASKVYLIHRRDEFRADKANQELIKSKDNIELVLNSNITKIIGDERVSGIEVTNNDGIVKTIDINGLFIAIGQIPSSILYKDLVELDKQGYIIAGEDCKTSVEGIFVAGDIRTKTLRQVVTAVSDGAVAANAAVAYIENI